jgi:thioredoxin 1
MNTLIIILAILALGGLYMFRQYRKIKNMPAVADSPHVIHLTDANSNQYIQNGVVLIDFWAAWCMPCKMIAPVISELGLEFSGKATICKLNVDENPVTSQKFGIRSIPSLVILKNGKEVERIVGVKNKPFISQKIEKHL